MGRVNVSKRGADAAANVMKTHTIESRWSGSKQTGCSSRCVGSIVLQACSRAAQRYLGSTRAVELAASSAARGWVARVRTATALSVHSLRRHGRATQRHLTSQLCWVKKMPPGPSCTLSKPLFGYCSALPKHCAALPRPAPRRTT